MFFHILLTLLRSVSPSLVCRYNTFQTSFNSSSHRSTLPSFHLFILPLFHPYIQPSVQPSLLPSVILSIRPSVHPSTLPPSICPSAAFPFVHPFIPPSIRPSVHPIHVDVKNVDPKNKKR